jgi:polar amino acid transport system permease protein
MDYVINQYFDLKNYVFSNGYFGDLMAGFWFTIKLSILGGALSLTWGLVLAVLRQSRSKAMTPVRWLTIAYIDVFRGIPLLLVLLLVSGVSVFGAPIGGEILPKSLVTPTWLGQPSPFWYGIAALTITYGAYMAEVYRAGIEAVPRGQMEAARSLGMSHRKAMRFVIVPQAVRKVIPPLLNDFIALMKDTSLVAFLGLAEVVQAGRDIYADTFNSSGFVFGAVLFLIVTIPLARLVDYLIAREQRRTQRGGGGGEGGAPATVTPPGAPDVTALAGGRAGG